MLTISRTVPLSSTRLLRATRLRSLPTLTLSTERTLLLSLVVPRPTPMAVAAMAAEVVFLDVVVVVSTVAALVVRALEVTSPARTEVAVPLEAVAVLRPRMPKLAYHAA